MTCPSNETADPSKASRTRNGDIPNFVPWDLPFQRDAGPLESIAYAAACRAITLVLCGLMLARSKVFHTLPLNKGAAGRLNPSGAPDLRVPVPDGRGSGAKWDIPNFVPWDLPF
jgi:hypothetical protein